MAGICRQDESGETLMREGLLMRLAQVAEWALKTLTAVAFALASWCLLEVVQLKSRMSVVEKVQNGYSVEMTDLERSGSPAFRTHDLLDQQRDLELRTRLSRNEAALDKIATAMEQIPIIATDVRWLKETKQKERP